MNCLLPIFTLAVIATVTCSELKTSVVCEHKTLSISCPEGTTPFIYHANYGRTSSALCPGPSSQKTNCVFSVTDKLANLCKDKSSCSVRADNGVFTDPCGGVFKYLEVTYQCVPKGLHLKTKVVCEHQKLDISCPGGQQLDIYHANYGRTSSALCPGAGSQKTNCPFEVTDKLTGLCKEKSSCGVTADNGVFTDPCRGTFKYLQVSYQCSSPPKAKECKDKGKKCAKNLKKKGQNFCTKKSAMKKCKKTCNAC